jgi:hypothetical protein
MVHHDPPTVFDVDRLILVDVYCGKIGTLLHVDIVLLCLMLLLRLVTLVYISLFGSVHVHVNAAIEIVEFHFWVSWDYF